MAPNTKPTNHRSAAQPQHRGCSIAQYRFLTAHRDRIAARKSWTDKKVEDVGWPFWPIRVIDFLGKLHHKRRSHNWRPTQLRVIERGATSPVRRMTGVRGVNPWTWLAGNLFKWCPTCLALLSKARPGKTTNLSWSTYGNDDRRTTRAASYSTDRGRGNSNKT